jgi:hypothetical protein
MSIKKQPSIEAGWRSYRDLVMPPDTPDIQRSECRLAFWAGASTLFYSIMDCLDPGEEPTDADEARMAAIHGEIDKFCSTFDAEVFKRHGGQH